MTSVSYNEVIGMNFHTLFTPKGQFAWNEKSYILGKIRKYFKMLSDEFFTIMLFMSWIVK